MLSAKAGDKIVLAEGEYIYSGDTPKGYMFRSEADGTKEKPITLASENPARPAVISGIDQNGSSALVIQGDWWILDHLKVTNAQKGIMINNSSHTIVRNCEIYGIGEEGLHFRDDSSFF